jgi:(p)ppGpp synthase/HD superfamily hydrolase
MTLDDYARALAFAARAHEGQVRKSASTPYIYHPVSVSALVLQFGGDEAQAIGGLLHDVVEDCGVTYTTITDQFGHRVAAIVEGCTDGEPDAQGK